MKFDIRKYEGKFVMHVKSEEEAKRFCNYLHRRGIERVAGARTYSEETYYSNYRDNTIYYFNEGTYGDISRCKSEYTILEWSDFMNDSFEKADLKTGDVILRRNGSVEIVNMELDTSITKDDWNDLRYVSDDLTDTDDSRYDIIAVRRPHEKYDCQFKAFVCMLGSLIYERKETEKTIIDERYKLSNRQIALLKKQNNI